MRIDKWLWCIRIYKTRTLATEACNSGKIIVNGIESKASRQISIGDIVSIKQVPIIKTIKIISFPQSRVGANILSQYITDLTPQDEYDKIEMLKMQKNEWRDNSLGRPTKRDRRKIDKFKDLESPAPFNN